jgi:hypothetical protein
MVVEMVIRVSFFASLRQSLINLLKANDFVDMRLLIIEKVLSNNKDNNEDNFRVKDVFDNYFKKYCLFLVWKICEMFVIY